MKKALTVSALAASVFPAIASAQNIGGIFSLLNQANQLINQVIPFIIALTVLVFLWGVFMFVVSGADSEKRKEAQGYMIWGIIALFVMVSVWGLVNILVRSLNLDTAAPPAPMLPPAGGQYAPQPTQPK